MTKAPKLLGVTEIARELGMTRQGLHYHLRRIQVEPYAVINGQRLFREADVAEIARKIRGAK